VQVRTRIRTILLLDKLSVHPEMAERLGIVQSGECLFRWGGTRECFSRTDGLAWQESGGAVCKTER